MRIVLITPPPSGRTAVAAAYEHQLVTALRRQGHMAEVHALSGPDAAEALLSRLHGARPIVDGLALPFLAAHQEWLRANRAVGLIRHPSPLSPDIPAEERILLRRQEQALLPLLDHVIVTSDAVTERLQNEFGVSRARISVVVAGVPDAPRASGSGGPGCSVLSVGALVPRKGHDILIRALARLVDLEWTLHIAGTPDRHPAHAAALRDLVKDLRVGSQVSFVDTNTNDIEALWRQADLFALATHWEGYPEAVAEALRRGLPVAVAAGGATDQLVPQDAGVVCAPGDANGLSTAMRRLIFDQPLRTDMAEAAWQFGRTLPNWATQARRFIDAIGA